MHPREQPWPATQSGMLPNPAAQPPRDPTAQPIQNFPPFGQRTPNQQMSPRTPSPFPSPTHQTFTPSPSSAGLQSPTLTRPAMLPPTPGQLILTFFQFENLFQKCHLLFT